MFGSRIKRLSLPACVSASLAAFGLSFGMMGDVQQARADLIGHGGMVRAIDISPDGDKILTASFDYTARVWDFGSQAEIAVLDGHEGPVTDAVFLPDGRRGLTTSDDRTAILWDLTSGAELKRFEGHQHKVMTVAVTDDSLMVATGSWDQTVKLWELGSGKELKTLSHRSPINSIVFFDGGTRLAAGTHEGKIHVWDVAEGRETRVLEGHAGGISQLRLSPDGKTLVSASLDRTLRLWDLASGEERATLKHTEARVGQVYGVALSPRGDSLLSTGMDGRVIQWDVAKGTQLRVIEADKKPIWSVRFSPDGRFALTANARDTAQVWHLETGDRVGLADEGKGRPEPWLTSEHPGAKLFTKCARCHALTAAEVQRSGPHFEGLWDRQVGALNDYKYSQALKTARFKWDETTLFRLFDEGPDVMLPGTKMPVQRVTDAARLRELVAYLKELTATAPKAKVTQ